MAKDWLAWHRDYDDPSSDLSRRLVVVRRRVGESLDALGPRARAVLSLCAGEGRDLIPELALRPHLSPAVLLVEANVELVDAARNAAADAGIANVRVRCADAGLLASFSDVLPVDLLLLCGIFGNVGEQDIRRTLGAVPALLRPGGRMIWTRGGFGEVDLRPSVRRWVADAGLEELAYDGEPGEPHGVGLALLARPPAADAALPERLFTFLR